MNKRLMAVMVIGLVCAGLFIFLYSFADTGHIVISQVQTDSIAGIGGTEDDWVELYNPTSNAVDLSTWSIQKTSSTGGSLYRKQLSGSIPAHGYFLIVRNNANTQSSLKTMADVLAAGSSFTLSDDNTVYLISNNNDVAGKDDPDIVDMVGFGLVPIHEGTQSLNPPAAGSIERKPGGNEGNGIDTNDNFSDFFIQSSPHPRNSQSQVLPVMSESSPTPTPSETPTPTPSPTPTPTETLDSTSSPQASPTAEATPSVAPTPSPTATPSSGSATSYLTPTPIPTPTLTHSPIPTVSVTPIPSLSSNPTPIETLTPTPTIIANNLIAVIATPRVIIRKISPTPVPSVILLTPPQSKIVAGLMAIKNKILEIWHWLNRPKNPIKDVGYQKQ